MVKVHQRTQKGSRKKADALPSQAVGHSAPGVKLRPHCFFLKPFSPPPHGIPLPWGQRERGPPLLLPPSLQAPRPCAPPAGDAPAAGRHTLGPCAQGSRRLGLDFPTPTHSRLTCGCHSSAERFPGTEQLRGFYFLIAANRLPRTVLCRNDVSRISLWRRTFWIGEFALCKALDARLQRARLRLVTRLPSLVPPTRAPFIVIVAVSGDTWCCFISISFA